MLLNRQPGRSYDYGCLLVSIAINEGKTADGLIEPPIRRKVAGFIHYRFVFGGLMWVFVVSGRASQFPFKEHFLQEDGTLTIHKKMFDQISFLMDSYSELPKQGKLTDNSGESD